MTRKCVVCKETNYRNTYSFFSAPKDAETRKKWKEALGMENYAVTDETYVCSKHFHKDDVITHWVSGVPPHVVSIKYKKRRLRPGAVPERNYVEENSQTKTSSTQYNKIRVSKFLMPGSEEQLQINNDVYHKITSSHHEVACSVSAYNPKNNFLAKVELLKLGNSMSPNNISQNASKLKESQNQNLQQIKQNKATNFMEDTRTEDNREEQNQTFKENSYSTSEDRAMAWQHKIIKKEMSPFKEELTSNDFKAMENVYIKNEVVNNLNYNQLGSYYSTCNKIEGNEMLFEDLLEVCTEVSLPHGWSCIVTSKGYTTTIVYLYLGMAESGMPYTEKQVFIKSDMILNCTAVNRNIDPLIHNLIREGKNFKVQNLIDIEELIDEFDQRTICQGIHNTGGSQDINRIKIAYKDGIQWRHVLCPLIINNDSSRCTSCLSLSYTLQRKPESLVFPRNPSILTKQQQKIQSNRQKYKRTKRQDREYEFIKVFKQ